MKIKKITILTGPSITDEVFLFTDLPSSMPNITDQNLIVSFHVASKKGVEYVKQHFTGIPFDVETLG